jgi:DNA polymerase elongation subunit (family B)
MKIEFIPIDYSYFDFEGKNYALIYGRDKNQKKICLIDSCPIYLWAILKESTSSKEIEKLIDKIKNIEIDSKIRRTKIEIVEFLNKFFLGKPVKALKVHATNYKDLHEIANKLNFTEIEKRRGYDLGYATHYIIEKKLEPLKWYEIDGEMLNNSTEFGGIDKIIRTDFVIKLNSFKKIKNEKFEPKVLAYDIETDNLKIGQGEILMISLVSKNFRKVITWKKSSSKKDYVEFVNNEKEMIEKFCECVKKLSPDFLVGYFSDGFDMPYIKERAKKLKIKLSLGLDESQPRISGGVNSNSRIEGISHIDLLKFISTTYAQYMQSETLTLNEVAREFLKDTKIDFKIKHSSNIKEEHWQNYYEYNLHDSELTLKLFEKFWPDLMEFSKIIKEPTYEISRNGLSKQMESYILHNLENFNEIKEKRPTN